MRKARITLFALLAVHVALARTTAAQTIPTPAQVPVATQWVLDGVRNPAQKNVIKSVLMIVCRKDNKKGTGFAVSDGTIVTTNSHVIGSCTAQELEGTSSLGAAVKFSKAVRDEDRDLALLCPTAPLSPGLPLGPNMNPAIETEVETWGYPLRYEGPAPVLSRGYVAGYTTATPQRTGQAGRIVKRLIVNGAFNPGNSGGPLIDRANGKIIGVVVEKWTLFSPLAETVISGLQKPGARLSGTFQRTLSDGRVVPVSNEEAVASALKEFYEMSQVMVGEAISVSELNAFMKEKRQELGCGH